MGQAVVIYASKYGSTREVAEAVAAGLGADLVDAASPFDPSAHSLVVLGSPLYCNNFLETLSAFIKHHHDTLKTKRIAAFVLGATELEIDGGLTGDIDEKRYTQGEWAEGLARTAGGEVVATRGFGGRMRATDLDHRDRAMLEWFYRFLMHRPFEGFDQLNRDDAVAWGASLRAYL